MYDLWCFFCDLPSTRRRRVSLGLPSPPRLQGVSTPHPHLSTLYTSELLRYADHVVLVTRHSSPHTARFFRLRHRCCVRPCRKSVRFSHAGAIALRQGAKDQEKTRKPREVESVGREAHIVSGRRYSQTGSVAQRRRARCCLIPCKTSAAALLTSHVMKSAWYSQRTDRLKVWKRTEQGAGWTTRERRRSCWPGLVGGIVIDGDAA